VRVVCRLAQSVSRLLPSGLRFLRIPLPARPLVRLAASLPIESEAYGLTLFRACLMSGVGPPFPPAAQWSTAGRPIGPAPWLLSLLGRACQRLWLGHGYDVYQRFTCVGLAALPWSLAAWRSRLRLLLTDPPTNTGGTFPRSFAYRLTPAGRYQPLRPGREQLVEQLVSSSHKHLLVRQRTRATFRSHVGSRGGGRRAPGMLRP